MFNKNNENKRFKTVYDQGNMGSRCKIIVDTQTGINYLANIEGYAGGITVLLDKDGKPVVSPIES